jgi:hypothetical protein
MLKNLQRSPIGKAHFPELMKTAFAWYSQTRQKELMFTSTIPAVKQFVDTNLTFSDEFESEMINSIAELTHYILTHKDENVLHETIACVTAPDYLKSRLKSAWNGRHNSSGSFDEWYQFHIETPA